MNAWAVRFGEESLTGLEPLDRQSLDVHDHRVLNREKRAEYAGSTVLCDAWHGMVSTELQVQSCGPRRGYELASARDA